MAYASKELKAKVSDILKAKSKEMGIKLGFSLRISNRSKLILSIRSCSVDIVKNLHENIDEKLEFMMKYPSDYEDKINDLNYRKERNKIYIDGVEKFFSGEALEVLKMIRECLKCDYYNDSDVMRDYFDIAYYYDVEISEKFGVK